MSDTRSTPMTAMPARPEGHHTLLYSQLPASMRQSLMKTSGRSASFINGPVLDVLDWTGQVFNTPPSRHRLYCAVGLTIGFVLGNHFMTMLAGQTLKGVPYPKEEVTKLLRPLHGAIGYDFHATDVTNFWKKFGHFLGIGVFGASAAYIGSSLYFYKRSKQVKDPVYLDDYEEAATFAQGKPWGFLAAVTAVPGGSSGITHLPMVLPIFNYGLTLGNRFMLSSGFKVALPGFGKYFSNSHSTYKFGPVKLTNYMINYLCQNKDDIPCELPRMTKGILGPWYGDLSEETIDKFIVEAMRIREKHWQPGGMVKAQQEACKKELEEHFKGAGLEATLQKIGLNPRDAKVADNGWSGKFSDLVTDRARTLRKDYLHSYDMRHAEVPKAIKAIETGEKKLPFVSRQSAIERLAKETPAPKPDLSKPPLRFTQRAQNAIAAPTLALGS